MQVYIIHKYTCASLSKLPIEILAQVWYNIYSGRDKGNYHSGGIERKWGNGANDERTVETSWRTHTREWAIKGRESEA